MINIKSFILIFCVVFVNYSVLSDEADKVTTTSSDFETTLYEDEIYDPIEPINRAIFGFNNIADKIILEPAAKTYRILPSPIQTGFSNFLSNLRAPLVIVNQLLQGQGGNAAETTGRLLVNTTAGVFGLFDLEFSGFIIILKDTSESVSLSSYVSAIIFCDSFRGFELLLLN